MSMFSQNEILLMIGVVSVLLICITILTILDIKDYLKAKHGLILEEESLEEEAPSLEPITVSMVEEKKEEVEEEKEIAIEVNETEEPKEVYFEEMEDESFEEKPVITPIQEEIVMPREEIKKEKKRLDILDELEEIENNLPNKKDDVTNFEMEQERTAIISLDELLKKSEDLYSDNEVVQYDDGNEPISIDEVLKMFKKDDEEVQAVEEKAVPEVFQEVVEENKVQEQVEEKELYSKKETIPFISSIYGIEQDSNALEFENTATYEKLDRQNQNDFITQLREMNENK